MSNGKRKGKGEYKEAEQKKGWGKTNKETEELNKR